ncbi:flagellar hook-length control protein FliK [Robbsia sp. KACC 23696]|uniref:flagellar hook-length control protein FliK n=1 Tax=Robbsia sp. KACC 23696 TaxID=3149231 RepID=UPI00325C1282
MNALDRIGQNPVPLRVDTMVTGATGGMGARASGPGTGSVAQQQTGVAAGSPNLQAGVRLPPSPAAVTSTYATVSSDARVLDALARLPSEEPLILSDKPLCPVPPTSNTGQAGDAPNVGNHFTSLLAKALVQSLENSGLFYESHLAQWASGQRPLASLEREPQARLAPMPNTGAQAPQEALPAHDELIANALTAFQSNAGALAGSTPAPAGDWFSRVADVLQNTLSGNSANAHGNGASQNSAGDGQPGANGGNTAHTQGGLANMASPLLEALSHLSPFSSHANASSAAAGQANPGNGAATHFSAAGLDPNALDANGMPNSLAHAVHPDALPTVRQQMELLQNPTLRWTGEAWPGTQMAWEIERREEQNGPSAPDGPAEPSWRMHITLDLPQLGQVDAELQLVGDRLITRLKAAPECAAALLHDSDHFRERIANTGLELKGFAVRERNASPEAGGGMSGDHQAGIAS